MIILGLDVSTACVGICVVDSDIIPIPDAIGRYILKLDSVEFKGCKTIWEKADVMQKYLECFKAISDYKIGRIVLEEPLTAFRPGMSSATTISTLVRFNGVVSYIARNIFDSEPEYIGSGHARKLCGIKLERTATGGPQKEQVFKYMKEHDLKHVRWPLKKNGKEQDCCRDMCDAYVISRAASINGPIQPPAKKSKKIKVKS